MRLTRHWWRAAAMLAALTAGFPAQAACVGANLLETLPQDDRAALDAAVAASPYADGNHWRATGGTSVIDIFGTFHLYDPRMDEVMDRIAPFVETADALLVEATDAELKQIETEITRRPELLFIGPGEQTLPERLDEAEWQNLSDELKLRGMAPFIASKFQPWYLTVLLAIPSCAVEQFATQADGLDKLMTMRAEAAGVPVSALEPYDTLFRMFDELGEAQELDMLRTSIAMASQAEDMFATMTEAYFAGQHRLIWEYSRQTAADAPGMTPERAARDFALMEDILLTRRNLAWIDKIEPAAENKRIVVAVGAAHLSGETGLLNLLAEKGYTLTREPF